MSAEPVIAFDPEQEDFYRQEFEKKLKNRRWRLDLLVLVLKILFCLFPRLPYVFL